MHRLLIIGLILLLGCGKKIPYDDPDENTTIELPAFGSEETLDIITWNLEWFPKENNTTIDYVVELSIGDEKQSFQIINIQYI